MMGLLPLGLALFLPRAAALSSAEEWSDFADNFATDLAPLITLFGEQVTKQFLSESVSFFDNVIFGLGPLGILTAVVSVIRLYGKASLKSFIGRAQEAHGVAEAELCSSTSQDVCELWSNGGICRVFGRPKILEFIYTKGQNFYPIDTSQGDNSPPHCGIYRPNDVLNDSSKAPDGSSRHWIEVDKSPLNSSPNFAPFPNLSLNVGTRRTSKRLLAVATAAGLLLETSFFAYATWATFYNPSFYTEEDTPHPWSFVLGMTGTLVLMCGMTLCAALIERRSSERRFRTVERRIGMKPKPRIFWVQCGDQRVGDQQFRSFAYGEEKKEYTTSYINQRDWHLILGLPPNAMLWIAVVSSLLGFACQFVGFRGLHGSVTLYQLACTLAMSIIRALLRSRRLGRDQNLLENFTRLSESAELDWQALAILSDDYPIRHSSSTVSHTDSWGLMNSCLDTGMADAASKAAQGMLASPSAEKLLSTQKNVLLPAQNPEEFEMLASCKVDVVVSKGDVGSGIVGFQLGDDPPGAREYPQGKAVCAMQVDRFIRILEGDIPDSAFVVKPLAIYGDRDAVPAFDLNPAARALNIRARLAHLTGDAFHPPSTQWDPELQNMAKRLQGVLQDAAGYLLDKVPVQNGWKGVTTLAWSAVCQYQVSASDNRESSLAFPIHFIMRRKGYQWSINEYQLAAVLGLWRQDVLQRRRRDLSFANPSSLRHGPARKIMQAVDGRERATAVIRLWIAKEGTFEHKFRYLTERNTASLVPFRLSVEESFRPRSSRQGARDWEQYAQDADVPEPSSPNRASLISLPTTASVLEMIAQDIFTTFMFEAASLMDKLTEVSVRQPLDNTSLRNSNTPSSDLSNPHIDALARILCEARLATEQDALMCIIPAVFHQSKLPSLEDCVRRMLDDAKKLRTNRQYEKGEEHLKSLLRVCSAQHQEKVVRALGELCRHACRSPNELHRDFGLRTMGTLKNNLVLQGEAALSQAAMVALDDYGTLAMFLARHTSKNGVLKPRELRNVDLSRDESRVHGDLRRIREKRCRSWILIMLERYDFGPRYIPAVLYELLFIAIELGYYEVLEDLSVLIPKLIFDVPSSAVGQGDATNDLGPLSKLIRTKFSASDELRSREEMVGYNRPRASIGFLATAWAASQLQHEGRAPGVAEEILTAMLDWVSRTGRNRNTPLEYAASSGNIELVDILLQYGVDFLVRTPDDETALSLAITYDHASVAERILKQCHAQVSLPLRHLRHALSVALDLHQRPYIELLLRNGINLDEGGETLLSEALKRLSSDGEGDIMVVALLIEYGATMGNLLDDVLRMAVDRVAPDWIRQLHSRGHDVVAWLTEKGTLTAVLEAAIAAKEQMGAAFPHQPDKKGRVNSLVRLLLELGVPVQPGDLHRAVRLRSPDDVIAMLLERGTSNNTILEGYGTPLQTLLNNNLWDGPATEQENLLDMMLRAGCDANRDSPEWKATPLQIACSRSEFYHERPLMSDRETLPEYSDKLPLMLLRAGAKADLTAADIPGEGRRLIRSTPLELACLTGKVEVVQALINAGVDVNRAGGEFGPSLLAACVQFGQRSKDDVEIVCALITAGANVNAIRISGRTILAVAAYSLLPEVVKTLLEAGADPFLNAPDQTDGADRDTWEAVLQPSERLFSTLKSTFNEMQTGPFKCKTEDRGPGLSGAKWKQIKELFVQHGVVRPQGEPTPADVSFSGLFQEGVSLIRLAKMERGAGWNQHGEDSLETVREEGSRIQTQGTKAVGSHRRQRHPRILCDDDD